MDNNKTKDAPSAAAPPAKDSFAVSAPAIELPKGGGAIRGIGEKFAANPVTGTGSMSVPIATSPGRAGFGPQLSLSYDSGAGNGAFGLGWNLSLPSITRKTDKGLPKYRDADESDVFILSGAEDLVPVLRLDAAGHIVPGADGRPQFVEETRNGYRVRRYRPRIEGLFARIEKWTALDGGQCYWRSISKDNITTCYGKTEESRIADPADPTRIFSWLICESYDDKGNAMRYRYKGENAERADLSAVNERNRSRSAQRYLKRIQYGNKTPHRQDAELSQHPDDDWMFEVVFDYGEHYIESGATADDQSQPTSVFIEDSQRPWAIRQDPFSSNRSGFEVRTYRLCQRVLMFHHFAELGRADYLVRATHFRYREGPGASFIAAVTQSGYLLQGDTYIKRSLPPVEFEYSTATIDETVREVDADSLENLPSGLDGANYQWVDLDGEGLSGILTEQGGAWFYKRNLGAVPISAPNETPPRYAARFAPLERLRTMPSTANLRGGQQLLDLAGDGQLDVVEFDSTTPGFFERTHDEDWETFTVFKSLPNVDWKDPNLKFVDLTGDGHADILVTENEVFTWYPSLAEEGFGAAEKTRQAFDEEAGPRLVFADGTQSIYLADMCGDGLTDLVRVRNGEVCYWPNLGYGRFGKKVTMDNAPWVDAPDQFDQKRIRLADIDGSGTTDLIYLHRQGVRLYFNQAGNRWSEARQLGHFPLVDNLSSVMTADLLGNGTACLVWSSPLAMHGRSPIRYVDLMGGQKPHLLIRTNNNLGSVTEVVYAPSTKFYLADQRAGTPWVTRIPFPVHCIESMTVSDRWRGTRFTTTYRYHHGYFDGQEREFRGFGRVEQIDSEHYGEFAAGNSASPYITDDRQLYQPPVKTITWFHTGAMLDRERILSHFAGEYFPNTAWAGRIVGGFQENALPEPDLATAGLSTAEWREALRACKGMTLRQEIYELDVDALAEGIHRPVKLFSAANHNCHIRMLQPRANNRHAVFLVTEAQALTYHYELDLREPELRPDPRIAHTLNLNSDEYGNALQSVAVMYPRVGQHIDPTLPPGAESRIAAVQQELHLAYTETRYTNDVDGQDSYRLRVPCEVKTYELTPQRDSELASVHPRDHRYCTLEQLRALRLSTFYQAASDELTEVPELPYHRRADGTAPQKRLVEQVRTLFFDTDLVNPLAWGELNSLGLAYESYKLALTDELLAAVFNEEQRRDARPALENSALSGYHRFLDSEGQFWMRSGVAGFQSDAARHFYLPERYTDAFGNTTTLSFDTRYHLFLESSRDPDPVGNITRVDAFDYRVLAPSILEDINDNLTEVVYDILGLPAAVAVKGKRERREGDHLEPLVADINLLQPPVARVAAIYSGPYEEAELQRLLATATARHFYWFGETVDPVSGAISYNTSPAGACGILREIHVADLAAGAASPIQVSFEYSDGSGNILAKKIKAEPEVARGPIRWLTNGKTVLNNKGKPVKQYEPYFSTNEQRFKEPAEVGVTPIVYYDAAGRTVRTEQPDGSYSRVEFSPWHVRTYDQNDTVLEPGNAWYAAQDPRDPNRPLPTDHAGDVLATPAQCAAWLAAQHADTPAAVFLDSLGREVISVAHNKFEDRDRIAHDEKYLTFTKLDAEGKPLWIRDARGNLVMQYIAPPKPAMWSAEPNEDVPAASVPCYDIAGNLLFQHSMDAGDRWMLMDAAGKPMLAWDVNETPQGATTILENRLITTYYDVLHRPVEQWLRINTQAARLVERFEYGESHPQTEARNLRGQTYRHYDPSGLVSNERYDFNGNLLEVTRRLASAYDAPVVDWSEGSPTARLEAETYTQRTEYDALKRMTRLYNWHLEGRVPAVYIPQYNERGVLKSEALSVRGQTATDAVLNIEYDAKGQRIRIEYGNGTTTRYHYDPLTFRLRQLRTTRTSPGDRLPSSPSNLSEHNALQNLYYTYDPMGNITEIHDDAYTPVFFNNQIVKPRNRYSYDSIYRLIKASGRENYHATDAPGQIEPDASPVTFQVTGQTLRDYTQHYTYDPVGNFLEMCHVAPQGSWTRHYDPAADSNRLLRTWLGSDSDATDAVRYDYDTHGSMLNLNRTPADYRLRWDYRDMIHNVNLGGGGQAYYNYDAGKQRTRKRIEQLGGTVEERIYLGGMEHYRRYNPAGAVVEEIETHHLFVDEQRVLMVEDVLSTDNTNLDVGTLYRYQYSNHLGSVGLELDGNAAVISYEEYHPYGTTAYRATGTEVRATAKRYRYTGMERDEETGLSYHTARYYLPWLGRWGSADPIGVKGGLNLYGYCGDNPVPLSDKKGMQPQPVEWDLALANWLDSTGIDDAAAGFGDILSLGATREIRRATGTNDTVDESSGAYAGGQVAGVVVQSTLLAGATVAAAPAIVRTVQAGASMARAAPMALAESTIVPISRAIATRTMTIEAVAAVETTGEIVVGLTTEPGEVPDLSPSPAQEIAQSIRASVRASRTVVPLIEEAAPIADDTIQTVTHSPSLPEVIDEAQGAVDATAAGELPALADISEAALRVQALERFRQIVAEENALLSSIVAERNGQVLVERGILSQGQLNSAAWMGSAVYGNALEALARVRALQDPLLRDLLEPLRTGANLPDFWGRAGTVMEGMIFDITTEADALNHYHRFYGENMVVITY